ncbi:hypothetical protein [Acinetobacter phage Ab69]|nr:hypothetical protein [Acinetobacter phage Ab69]
MYFYSAFHTAPLIFLSCSTTCLISSSVRFLPQIFGDIDHSYPKK